jgi:hypothetical protein
VPPAQALGKDPKNAFFKIFFYIYIYIYIYDIDITSKAHAKFHKSIENPPKFNITSLLLQVQHPYCGGGECNYGLSDCGDGPDCGVGLTVSALGDTIVGLFEPADGGCTKEIACVRLKIKNFDSTSPAWGGFQPARNNDT